jgi:hypothetical protein
MEEQIKMNQEWFEQVCQSALGHRTSQEQTYDIARVVLSRGIPGDFVECGVFAGSSCAIMAMAILDHYRDSGAPDWWRDSRGPRVHLFDSFDGIPTPGPHDDPAQVREGEARCSLANVKNNMRKWGIPDELLVYHQGDFRDTVPVQAGRISFGKGSIGTVAALGSCEHRNPFSGRTEDHKSFHCPVCQFTCDVPPPPIESVALLRLDGDLYESTKVCMQYLYPLVSKGGYVICDDYDLHGCRYAVHETVMPAPIVWRKWT